MTRRRGLNHAFEGHCFSFGKRSIDLLTSAVLAGVLKLVSVENQVMGGCAERHPPSIDSFPEVRALAQNLFTA